MSLLERHFAGPVTPTPDAVNEAFWHACDGRQRQAAEYLLARGADLNRVPDWTDQTPLDFAESQEGNDLVGWLHGQGAKSAKEPK
jgi:ankyrin repeat protein